MAETLPSLPDVQFVETDAQQVINTMMQSYTQHTGRTLADGDPTRQWLLSVAYVVALLRAQINDAARGNLLHYAHGAQLEHIGVMRQVQRLQAEPARDRLRVSLSASRLVPTVVPAGTRVTADNRLYWRTVQPLSIPAGQAQGVVPVVALTPGAVGNVVQPGELVSLVDPVPFVASVTNLDGGQGGRDTEGDEALRYRIYMSPAAFSVAGPAEAYKYWAYTAHAAISDVLAHSPEPGVAEIRPLLEGGVLPDAAILDAVDAVLSDATRRPMADHVTVLTPEAASYNITAVWYLARTQQALQTQITEQVNAALAKYIAWQRGKLGRDIDPGELNALVRAAGAKRVVIASPTFTVLAGHQVAQEGAVSLTFGGVEDE